MNEYSVIKHNSLFLMTLFGANSTHRSSNTLYSKLKPIFN